MIKYIYIIYTKPHSFFGETYSSSLGLHFILGEMYGQNVVCAHVHTYYSTEVS